MRGPRRKREKRKFSVGFDAAPLCNINSINNYVQLSCSTEDTHDREGPQIPRYSK